MPASPLQPGCHAWPGLLLLPLLAGAGCGAPAATPRAGRTEVYACADGQTFVARYERERVWLFLDGQAVSAPQVPAGPSLHYASGAVALRGEGGTVTLTLPAAHHDRCVLQPDEQAWADARLRGVDFRAVGADGTWVLELREGRQVRLAGPALGDHVAPFPHQGLDEAERATYDIAAPYGSWRVTIERAPCAGAGAHESAARVGLDADGRSFNGCGRFLR